MNNDFKKKLKHFLCTVVQLKIMTGDNNLKLNIQEKWLFFTFLTYLK